MEDMFELMEAIDNILISRAMGWDMDGAFERLRVAKARIDAEGDTDAALSAPSTDTGVRK